MIRHTVQEGESLSRIADSYGLDVRDVLAANPQKARVELASGVQVFQSLSAGEDIELPGTLGDFGSFVKTYSGYDAAKKAITGKAAETTFTEEEKVTGGCAEGYRYDPSSQTCIRKLPKIGVTPEVRLQKVQEANRRAREAAQAAAATAQAAAAGQATAAATSKRKLLIAGGVVGVVLLGIGGAVWAFKK